MIDGSALMRGGTLLLFNMEKKYLPNKFKAYLPLIALFALMVFLMPRTSKFTYDYQKGDIFPVDKTKKELDGLMAIEIDGHVMLAWTQDYPELNAIKFEFANKNYPSFYWPKIYMNKIKVIGTVVLYTEDAIVF